MISQCVNCGSTQLDKSKVTVCTLSKSFLVLGNQELPSTSDGDTILYQKKEDVYVCLKCSCIHRYLNPSFEDSLE
jgi:hypothetical protein